jgi:hypothetical protein
MIHPSDPETHQTAVRDGQLAPVTCAACGCRLAAEGDAYVHFAAVDGRDARGCRVPCIGAVHDAKGRPIPVTV